MNSFASFRYSAPALVHLSVMSGHSDNKSATGCLESRDEYKSKKRSPFERVGAGRFRIGTAVYPFAENLRSGLAPGHPRADARNHPDVTPTDFGGEINAPVTVYDTSGPYTDPNVIIDVRKGG